MHGTSHKLRDWIVVIIIGAFVVNNPEQAGSLLGGLLDLLVKAGDSLGTFAGSI